MINHAERSPADCANAASRAVRAFNHLTVDPTPYVLDEVYAVLGALGEMTARLEQSTVQIVAMLHARLTAGGLRTDASSDDSAATVVGACRDDLVAAGSLAGQLEALISDAHRRVDTLADTPASESPSGRSPGRASQPPNGSRTSPSRSM